MEDYMETKSKSMDLRYCPVVKHNVVLELDNEMQFGKKGAAVSICLNAHKCLNDRGGCTNKIFSCK
jgi:hypothetical protein